MVLDDRRMKVREIAETMGISKERVRYILHEELDMKKLCARWVPRLLTADQKRTRTKISEQLLERFNKNKTDFVRRFITMDETWIHHYTPESKQQSKQ
jgi:histone-lysine N-methyltransferase SETMAR